MTIATTTDAMYDFLCGELRAIRPTLPAELPPAAHYTADLNLDSLDLVELIARIEQRYPITVPDADLQLFTSLEATRLYIVQRIDTYRP